MTGCCQDPITTAYEIKNRVHAELGFTVNIGVSEISSGKNGFRFYEAGSRSYALEIKKCQEKCGIFRWVICFMWAMPLYTS